ncbi:hypothetical protein P7F88_01895 [Vibrio hannami]|uniref:hypothetical protein n=1 Tax=Vibrio hannami TaxID=2717094 RepID=UPI00240F78D2|nr:hypothetical protein [Vibrio hannami]MDG3084907.1 hypothetical protein [Vibrio hannami]
MIKSRFSCLILLITALAGASLPYNGLAQELSSYTVRKVQRAYQLQQEGSLKQAIDMLESIESSRKFDVAYVNRMLGSLYWQTEKNIRR